MACSLNPHSQSRLRLHPQHTHAQTHVSALKYVTYTVINVHSLADDITYILSQLQPRLKLLKGAIDRRDSGREEQQCGLKYFYHKATYPRHSSETERQEQGSRDGVREGRGWLIGEDREDRSGYRDTFAFASPWGLQGTFLPGPRRRPAWRRHHGLSGELPGDRPRHFEPLHPHRQLRYLAPGLPDIMYHVWLPGQRSHEGVRPGPTADTVSHQAGGDAELSGSGGTVGHGQHDHNLPRANTLGL